MKVTDGTWVEDEAGEQRIAKTYFQTLFFASSIRNEGRELMGINRCIDENMNLELMREFQKEEIEVVVMSMALAKASREDGFLALFFQKF